MIADNLNAVKEQIKIVAKRCGRDPNEIKLIAVSKKFSAERVIEACEANHYLIGENYIQEVIEKRPHIPESAIIHFIGHLQSNKAKSAAELCNVVETVDRTKLGRALNKHCATIGKTLDILIQVNIGNDPNKSGVDKDSTRQLLEKLNEMEHLRVCGLMTMPPLSNTPEESRVYFRDLRLLAEELKSGGYFPNTDKIELSMGMSGDFPIAIEEGATIIRIGTAIFGARTT